MKLEADNYVGQSQRAAQAGAVEVRDCSLREAEQAVGLTLEEKLRMARVLSEAGLKRLQVGAPGRSVVDREAIARLKAEGIAASLDAIAIAYVPDWKLHIDVCLDCGADTIDLVHPVSDMFLEQVLHIDREEMLDRVSRAVGQACHGGARVAVSAMDAPRASLEVLSQVAQSVSRAGACELVLCDSVGVAGPAWVGQMAGHLVRQGGLRIGIHCHNDLGLALANTLAAIENGATIADVTINGLGERAGNVSLDELVVVLNALHHLDIGVDTTQLTKLASLMSEFTRIPLSFNKPLVGTQAFVHRHDTHAIAAVTYPLSTEPVNPPWVGNERRFLPGKYSGPFVIGQIANRLGLTLTDEQANELARRVRDLVVETKGQLGDDDFLKLARESAKGRSEPVKSWPPKLQET